MALVGINSVNRGERRTGIEKILDSALKVAQLTNYGVDIVTGLKDRKLKNSIAEREQTTTEMDKFEPSTQETQGAFVLPGKTAFGQDAYVKRRFDLNDMIKQGQYSNLQRDSAAPDEATSALFKKIYGDSIPLPKTMGEARDYIKSGASTLQPGAVTERERFEKPDQFQRQSAGFGLRMNQSLPVIQKFEDMAAKSGSRFDQFASKVGAQELVSPEYQQYENAKRRFINSQLRRESGSSIRDEEFISAEKEYFPQPGDTWEVLAEKRTARAGAVAAMKANSGETAWNQVAAEFDKINTNQPKKKKVNIGGMEFDL
jgi:hypothetical protein